MNEQFWLEVMQAYNKVATDHELQIVVARDGKEAIIEWDEDYEGVRIGIVEVQTETKEALLSP